MAINRGKIFAGSKKSSRVNPPELFSRTQKRAYQLYEKRGCAHGNSWKDWFEAERQVKAELGIR